MFPFYWVRKPETTQAYTTNLDSVERTVRFRRIRQVTSVVSTLSPPLDPGLSQRLGNLIDLDEHNLENNILNYLEEVGS